MPTRDELFLAYRQAKASLFFERRGVGLIEFARFERDLPRRLDTLARHLSSNGGWFDDLPAGQLWLVPKRRRSRVVDEPTLYIGVRSPHASTSALDVQLRFTPSPEYAIVEVLFLWQFGSALDSLLSRNAVGYRLDLKNGSLSRTRRWLFEYWPKRYDEFRKTPVEVAIRQLERNRLVLLLSADLTSFYDTIDPSFMLDLHPSAPVKSEEYRTAISSLLRSYKQFRRRAARLTGLPWRIGIPIGALTSRIVANLALSTLDHEIYNTPTIRCYRRYVDDLVIVATPNDDLRESDLHTAICKCIPHITHSRADDSYTIDGAQLRRKGSRFRIQKRKCKAHYLGGRSGLDFVKEIRAHFGRLVSEQRAFLDPDVFAAKPPSLSLVRTGSPGQPLTVLRDVDRLRLEHRALSVRFSSLERISVLLNEPEARNIAKEVVSQTIAVVRGDDDWVANLTPMLRMLKIGTLTGNVNNVLELLRYMDETFGDTQSVQQVAGTLYIAEQKVPSTHAYVRLRDYLHASRLEAMCSVLRPSSDGAQKLRDALPNGIRDGKHTVSWRAIGSRARLLAAADLRAFDREDDAFGLTRYDKYPADGDFGQDDADLRRRLEFIAKFTSVCNRDDPWKCSASRLFLSTRPPSYFDVARRVLRRVEVELRGDEFDELLAMVNAIRGTEYRDPVGTVIDRETIRIPPNSWSTEVEIEEPQLILGHLVATSEYYDQSTRRRPTLTRERLRRVKRVLDGAVREAMLCSEGASFLVLPELSLPQKWFREVATHIARTGSHGLVVGLEYRFVESQKVVNQTFAVMPGPFQSVATWPWTKGSPAEGERKCLEKRGLEYSSVPDGEQGRRRVVVDSPYGRVTVLVCSELIEVRRVADLLQRVEVVAVPAWNKDTSSYDHLVQSAGLQLAAIVAIANNGEYSDCRVWAPRKDRWERDLCRLIQPGVDDVIAVRIPLKSLREWRTAGSGGEWRPLPPNWPRR